MPLQYCVHFKTKPGAIFPFISDTQLIQSRGRPLFLPGTYEPAGHAIKHVYNIVNQAPVLTARIGFKTRKSIGFVYSQRFLFYEQLFRYYINLTFSRTTELYVVPDDCHRLIVRTLSINSKGMA